MNYEMNNQVVGQAIAAPAVEVIPLNGEAFPIEQPILKQPDAAPMIFAVDPPIGAVVRKMPVTIKGQNFAQDCQVKFGGVDAPQVTFKSSQELMALTPTQTTAKSVDIQVINPDGQTALLNKAFEYVLLSKEQGQLKLIDAELLDSSLNIVGDVGTNLAVTIGDDNTGFGTIRAGQSASIDGEYVALACNIFGCIKFFGDVIDPIVNGLPPASQITFNPNPCGSNVPVRVTLSTSIFTPPGSYGIVISGVSRIDGFVYDPGLVNLNVLPAASVSLSPIQPTIASVNSSSATYRFRINRDGFEGAVGLNIRSADGLSFTPSNAGFTSGSEIAVTIQPTPGTPPRNYQLIVEPILQEGARSDVRLLGTSVTLQVGQVSIQASPSEQTVPNGGTVSYVLQINQNNFSGNVEFRDVQGLPTGVRATPNQTFFPTQIGITTDTQQARAGRSNLTIRCRFFQANGSEVILAAPAVGLTIVGPVTLLTDTAVRELRPGETTVYPITLDRQGFTGSVRLFTESSPGNSLPSGIQATIIPPETQGTTASLTIVVPPGIPPTSPGSSPNKLLVKGSVPTGAGSQGVVQPNLQQQIPVQIIGTEVNFRVLANPTLTVLPSGQRIPNGSSTFYDLQFNSNGLWGNLTFVDVQGLPRGVRATPNLATNPTRITLTTDLQQTPAGQFNLTVRCRFTRDNGSTIDLSAGTRLEVVGPVVLTTDQTVRDVPANGELSYEINVNRQGFQGDLTLSTELALGSPPLPAATRVDVTAIKVENEFSGILRIVFPPDDPGLPPGSPPYSVLVKGTATERAGSQGVAAQPNLATFTVPVTTATARFQKTASPSVTVTFRKKGQLLSPSSTLRVAMPPKEARFDGMTDKVRMRRIQTIQAVVSPPEERDKVTIEQMSTPTGGELEIIEVTKSGTDSFNISIIGKMGRESKNKGDISIVASYRSEPNATKVPVGKLPVSVVIPAQIANSQSNGKKEHDTEGVNGLESQNTALNEKTSPAIVDVPKDKFLLTTSYVRFLKLLVLDQFNDPIGDLDLYGGSGDIDKPEDQPRGAEIVEQGQFVDPSNKTKIVKKAPINRYLLLDSTYLDPVGFIGEDRLTGQTITSDSTEIKNHTDPQNPLRFGPSGLPGQGIGVIQNIPVFVDGFLLNPSVSGRSLIRHTSIPEQTDVGIIVDWPDAKPSPTLPTIDDRNFSGNVKLLINPDSELKISPGGTPASYMLTLVEPPEFQKELELRVKTQYSAGQQPPFKLRLLKGVNTSFSQRTLINKGTSNLTVSIPEGFKFPPDTGNSSISLTVEVTFKGITVASQFVTLSVIILTPEPQEIAIPLGRGGTSSIKISPVIEGGVNLEVKSMLDNVDCSIVEANPIKGSQATLSILSLPNKPVSTTDTVIITAKTVQGAVVGKAKVNVRVIDGSKVGEKGAKETKEIKEKEVAEKGIERGPIEVALQSSESAQPLSNEERLTRLEAAVSQYMQHFINPELRPDLEDSALQSESDLGDNELTS